MNQNLHNLAAVVFVLNLSILPYGQPSNALASMVYPAKSLIILQCIIQTFTQVVCSSPLSQTICKDASVFPVLFADKPCSIPFVCLFYFLTLVLAVRTVTSPSHWY